MKTTILPIIGLLSFLFLFACDSSKKATNISMKTLDCSHLEDPLEIALCNSHKLVSFDGKGQVLYKDAAKKLRSEYYLFNIDDISKVDNSSEFSAIEKGKEITDEVAEKLEDNAFDHRQMNHNYPKRDGTPGKGHRYVEPLPNYKLERSVYFAWSDILKWMVKVKANYGSSNVLGLRMFFGEYGTYGDDTEMDKIMPGSHYNSRSTIFLRVMKLKDGKLQKINSQVGLAKTSFNLGELCPPTCRDAAASPLIPTSKK